jgi:hypothetical protein
MREVLVNLWTVVGATYYSTKADVSGGHLEKPSFLLDPIVPIPQLDFDFATLNTVQQCSS